MITSPMKPKTVGLAAAAGQTQTDNRFGQRGIAPLQRNAATTPYKTSIRSPLNNLQKKMIRPLGLPNPIQPIMAPNTNQSANGTPLNQTQAPVGMPQYRPRPQFDPNAVNGSRQLQKPMDAMSRPPAPNAVNDYRQLQKPMDAMSRPPAPNAVNDYRQLQKPMDAMSRPPAPNAVNDYRQLQKPMDAMSRPPAGMPMYKPPVPTTQPPISAPTGMPQYRPPVGTPMETPPPISAPPPAQQPPTGMPQYNDPNGEMMTQVPTGMPQYKPGGQTTSLGDPDNGGGWADSGGFGTPGGGYSIPESEYGNYWNGYNLPGHGNTTNSNLPNGWQFEDPNGAGYGGTQEYSSGGSPETDLAIRNAWKETGIGTPGSNPYQYLPPAVDDRVTRKIDELRKGTDINVIGAPPKNPGRFDSMFKGRDTTSMGDRVAGDMGRFGSGVQVDPTGQANLNMPDRNTPMFDQFGKAVGSNQPGAPGREGGVNSAEQFAREGGNWNIGTTDAEKAASAAQMSASNAAAANGGMMTSDQISSMMNPYIQAAQAQAAEASGRGNAMLAKASGGSGLDTQSVSDVARQSADSANNMIGTKFSDIMQQNIAQRQGLLSTAGSLAGDVASREGGRSRGQADLNLGGVQANISQRGQDIGAAEAGRGQDVEQRAQDIGVAQSNADRLSKDMLGFAGLDMQKYQTDKGTDVEKMKTDLTAELQRRGMSLQEAQFKAGEFGKAFDRSLQTNTAQTAQDQQWAELAQKADQGDVQAGLQHSNQLLQQAVSSGQLTNEQSKMMLDNLYQYWNDPQKFQQGYIAIREQATAALNAANAASSGGSIGLGPSGFSYSWK
jgi:hypothetical protein